MEYEEILAALSKTPSSREVKIALANSLDELKLCGESLRWAATFNKRPSLSSDKGWFWSFPDRDHNKHCSSQALPVILDTTRKYKDLFFETQEQAWDFFVKSFTKAYKVGRIARTRKKGGGKKHFDPEKDANKFLVMIEGSRSLKKSETMVQSIRELVQQAVQDHAPEKDFLIIHGDNPRSTEQVVGELFPAKVRVYRADTHLLGVAAGAVRNNKMLEIAGAVVIIWDGFCSSQQKIIDKATQLGKPIYIRTIH